MGERSVVVGIGSGARQRDAFLADALRRGAGTALWLDVGRGWAEAYEAPSETPSEAAIRGATAGPAAAGPPRSFGRRSLVWPGEVRVLCSAAGGLRDGATRG